MMLNAGKPVEFDFTGDELLKTHKKTSFKVLKEVWHKTGRSKSYVFAFFEAGLYGDWLWNKVVSVGQVYLVIPYCVRYELCEAKKDVPIMGTHGRNEEFVIDFTLSSCYYKLTFLVNLVVRREVVVTYKTKSLEKICTDVSKAIRKYGEEIAQKIYQRIGRCHRLEGNRSGQYSVDLAQPYRLIFTVKGEEIQIAKIIEIVDYH